MTIFVKLNMTWVNDAHYMAIPKGVPPEKLAVVLDLMGYLLKPEAQERILFRVCPDQQGFLTINNQTIHHSIQSLVVTTRAQHWQVS